MILLFPIFLSDYCFLLELSELVSSQILGEELSPLGPEGPLVATLTFPRCWGLHFPTGIDPPSRLFCPLGKDPVFRRSFLIYQNETTESYSDLSQLS